MSITIRCDDYPYGDPRHVDTIVNRGKMSEEKASLVLRNACWAVMNIFEENNVNYIWGISPMLLNRNDFGILNSIVKNGKLVMHGFDHGVSVISKEEWGNIHDIYHEGGEYSYYKESRSFLNDFAVAHRIMSNFNAYDPTKFIPPFNAYNQVFLDGISNTDVNELYICNTEYEKFLNKLTHYHLKLSISNEGTSYSDINYVYDNWDSLQQDDHICLHPIYDVIAEGPGAIEKYRLLAEKIKNAS